MNTLYLDIFCQQVSQALEVYFPKKIQQLLSYDVNNSWFSQMLLHNKYTFTLNKISESISFI